MALKSKITALILRQKHWRSLDTGHTVKGLQGSPEKICMSIDSFSVEYRRSCIMRWLSISVEKEKKMTDKLW